MDSDSETSILKSHYMCRLAQVPPQNFSQLRFAFCACMDLRAHRVVGVPLVGGTHSQATSSTTLRRTSTTSSSRLGVIVRRTVAGAPSSQAPTRDTPCTSSSSLGSIGSPASNGTNPRLARPSAVDCWPQASFDDYNSSGVESRSMIVHNNSSRAPAGNRHILPPPTAFPVRSVWAGWSASRW